jgi:hypothetical protein
MPLLQTPIAANFMQAAELERFLGLAPHLRMVAHRIQLGLAEQPQLTHKTIIPESSETPATIISDSAP